MEHHQQHHHTDNILLFVFQNGLNGGSDDFITVERAIRSQLEKYGFPLENALFIRSECNQAKDTQHGLKLMGRRLAQEVVRKVKQFVAERHGNSMSNLNVQSGTDENDGAAQEKKQPVVLRGTFIGHSLGGLILRSAFRWLFHDGSSGGDDDDKNADHDDDKDNNNVSNDSNSSDDDHELVDELCEMDITIEPHSFITIVTPHLGSRRPAGQSAWHLVTHAKSMGANLVCNWLLGLTGLELHLEDPDQMLLQMTRGVYLSSLKKFRHRTAIATSFGDLMVPHCSASFRPQHPHIPPRQSWKPSFRILSHSGFEVTVEKKDATEEGDNRLASVPDQTTIDDSRDSNACIYRSIFARYNAMEETMETVMEHVQSSAHLSNWDSSATTQSTAAIITDHSNSTATVTTSTSTSTTNTTSAAATGKATISSTTTETTITTTFMTKFSRDKWNEIEYIPEMVDNLNSIPWRRIDLEFNVPLVSRGLVHVLPIALRRKLPFLHKEKSYKQAEQWVQTLASIVCIDLFGRRHPEQQQEQSGNELENSTRNESDNSTDAAANANVVAKYRVPEAQMATVPAYQDSTLTTSRITVK